MDFLGECAERRLWSSLTIEKKRLAWCRKKRWWTTQYQWSKVIFSDVSQVCIGQDKRVSVYVLCTVSLRNKDIDIGNVEKGGDRTW